MVSDDDIISVLEQTNFWGGRVYTGIKRDRELTELENISKGGDIIAVIGVRRCGKTTLLKQFLEKQIQTGHVPEQTLYVNFEEPAFDPYLSVEFMDRIYSAYRTFVNPVDKTFMVLDEIQNVPRWEKWVRMMQEKKENVKIMITGSSSVLLGAELGSVLTGRTITKTLFPLSFYEFLSFKGINTKKPELKKRAIKSRLQEYVIYGGFPDIATEDDPKMRILRIKEYYEGIIYRDISTRYGVRQTHLLKSLGVLAISSYSKPSSINQLKNALAGALKRKVSPTTINSFLSHMEESFLIFRIPLFSYKIKDQLQYPSKTYCIDTGMINAVNFRFSQDIGRLYENVVFLELKRRGKETYYWKDSTGKEVDFVIKEGLRVKQLIQVCYEITNKDTKKREVKSLIKGMEEFNLNEGLVITENYEGEEEFKGKRIRFIPLWKWLLLK